MQPIDPIAILLEEHNLVRRVLETARRQAERIGATGDYDRKGLNDLTVFLKNFVSRFHHGREEQLLFPELRDRLPHRCDLIDQLHQEHETGRLLLRRMAAALLSAEQGEALAPTRVEDDLTEYIESLLGHLRREEEQLFSEADRLLEAGDRERMAEALRRTPPQQEPAPTAEQLLRTAEELVRRWSG